VWESRDFIELLYVGKFFSDVPQSESSNYGKRFVMMTLPRITRFTEMDNVRQLYQELNAKSSMQVRMRVRINRLAIHQSIYQSIFYQHNHNTTHTMIL